LNSEALKTLLYGCGPSFKPIQEERAQSQL